jgi:HupE / UreJ protein
MRFWALIVSLAALLVALPAGAHPALTSAVFLDLGERSVEAELQLPLDQLGLALERPLDARPGFVTVADIGPDLPGYLASHVVATTRDERPFRVEVLSTAIQLIDGTDHLVAHLVLRPPVGAPTTVFSLRYDVILHRVVTHKIFLSIRRDFRNAVFSQHPELVGVFRFQRDTLLIDRSKGSWWRGFGSVFVLGARHIAEGTDHLLFLLVLLLPAPLLARGGRWRTAGSAGRSVKEVLKIVTAFTVGHSITLVCAATNLLHVPSRPVEILIALSILVSAVHALRPLFPGREFFVAAGFGLIHGLAFAAILADFGFDSWTLGMSVLGFNLGIEAMQLGVVLLIMPWLVLLSRSEAYPALRIGGASFAAVAACGWLGERALKLQNPVAPVVDLVFQRGIYVAGLLAIAAIVVTLRRRRAEEGEGEAAEAPGDRVTPTGTLEESPPAPGALTR